MHSSMLCNAVFGATHSATCVHILYTMVELTSAKKQDQVPCAGIGLKENLNFNFKNRNWSIGAELRGNLSVKFLPAFHELTGTKMIQQKVQGKEFKSTNNESIQLNYILKQSKKVLWLERQR